MQSRNDAQSYKIMSHTHNVSSCREWKIRNSSHLSNFTLDIKKIFYLEDPVALLESGGLGRRSVVHLADVLADAAFLGVQVEAETLEVGPLLDVAESGRRHLLVGRHSHGSLFLLQRCPTTTSDSDFRLSSSVSRTPAHLTLDLVLVRLTAAADCDCSTAHCSLLFPLSSRFSFCLRFALLILHVALLTMSLRKATTRTTIFIIII